MCIIVVKGPGSDFAPKDSIAECIRSNPHGFGMAWNENGEVKVFKTMDPREALAKYEVLTRELNPRTTAFIFHARIKTNGSIKLENCHPWVHNNLAFCHNGALRNVECRDDLTDSETFFRDYFVPVWETGGLPLAFKVAKLAVKGTCNKFAFLDGNGNVTFVTGQNPFIKEDFGGPAHFRGKIYFSNTSYRQPFDCTYTQGLFAKSVEVKPAKKSSVTSGSGLPAVGYHGVRAGGATSFSTKNK